MDQLVLGKKEVSKLLDVIAKQQCLVAPIKSSQAKICFERVKDTSLINLEKKSYYPVKNFFLVEGEVLFEFDGNKIQEKSLNLKETVFFGLRRCDLNGIMHQDKVFLGETKDPYYKKRRKKSVLIGFHCKEGDDYCFCNSFPLEDFFDLMLYDKGENYGVEIGSEKGREFARKHSKYFKEGSIVTDEDKKIVNKIQLNTTDIGEFYLDSLWKEEGSFKCLACGACTTTCVNCHCFEIKDSVGFDLKKGERQRFYTSCQLREFTRVAGEHIFRISKEARFKHRIYHQIKYFKDRHGVAFCTGCGRCIESCPARIDWVSIINKMNNEKTKNN